MSKTCIVIPCYNESKRFAIEEFNEFYEDHTSFYFCLIDDGSKDDTSKLLENLAQQREDRIKVIIQSQNTGKAEAVRNAVIQSLQWQEFDYVGYFDADFATPLSEMPYLIESSQGNHQIIMGARIKRLGANIERTVKRHYLGRIFATVASSLLRLPVYDTQCGAKIFKTEIASQIFQEPFKSRWLFDVELLFRFMSISDKEIAKQQILEVPLHQWLHKADSKITFWDMIKVPHTLYKLYSYYRKSINRL